MKMEKLISLFFVLACAINCVASDKVRPERIKYITAHKDDAIRDMIKTGVPASITLAQACLESQDGGSKLAREANNHFGIKCSDWKGPSFIQDDDEKDECFRKYKSTLDSYDDHSLFLKTRPRYSFLFELDPTDYKGWAKGLKKAGYATDPNYAIRLIKIIEDNQLYLLDQGREVQYMASINSQNDPGPYVPATKKIYVPAVEAVEAFPTRKILKINGIDCVIAKKGETLKSIAQEQKLGYWQLPRYNELKKDEALKEGQIVFLKPKKSSAATKFYTVKPGDTVLSISQANGIKSKYIYKYNHLPEGAKIEIGQQLKLKGFSLF